MSSLKQYLEKVQFAHVKGDAAEKRVVNAVLELLNVDVRHDLVPTGKDRKKVVEVVRDVFKSMGNYASEDEMVKAAFDDVLEKYGSGKE